ncbi:hypothetical protein BDP81DRAFT_109974 [Colletotrichum phormii]|uniref:Uncharacterized protein n=1 Tax=Colletotrichum phormii TaxID=359342 RepID=A0AAI9ZHT5_9PEZI|nr:uncharacterized protein BDP81DRAFT_109974 [Colletotrichum phormii]KAK1624508.1 hypothetical protein BDP81DRAFT_109974 [Colletotrichum phormii]
MWRLAGGGSSRSGGRTIVLLFLVYSIFIVDITSGVVYPRYQTEFCVGNRGVPRCVVRSPTISFQGYLFNHCMERATCVLEEIVCVDFHNSPRTPSTYITAKSRYPTSLFVKTPFITRQTSQHPCKHAQIEKISSQAR